MTVKELIGYLKTLPANSEVFLSQDEEGNDFKRLYDLENAWIDPSIWEPVNVTKYTNTENLERVVILWP